MTDLFEQFKQQQMNTATSLEDMQKELEEQSGSKQDFSDDRFYYPERDKTGLGQAIVRFLPTKTEGVPNLMQFHKHAFQANGEWYIEECSNDVESGTCAVCENTSNLWNGFDDYGNHGIISGQETPTEKDIEAGRLIVRGKDGENGRKRKMRYVVNIIVLKDPQNPENEGKTFLFQFGLKIHEKIIAAFKGDELEGKKGFDPFNLFSGAPFLLKIKNASGQTNYDDSKFLESGQLDCTVNTSDGTLTGMDAIKHVWENQYCLQSEYKEKLSYVKQEDQQKKLDKMFKGKKSTASSASSDTPSANASSDTPSANASSQPSANASTPSADGMPDFDFENI